MSRRRRLIRSCGSLREGPFWDERLKMNVSIRDQVRYIELLLDDLDARNAERKQEQLDEERRAARRATLRKAAGV